jgi:hypothetical protein
MMFVRKNRLGMALTLESHLAELQKDLTEASIPFVQPKGDKPARRLAKLMDDCYVCNRIEFNFAHMIETVVLLWDTDEEFVKKLKAQPYICLPHYRRLLDCAHARLGKKKQPAFAADLSSVVMPYMKELNDDISWFCKKFDYRYDQEPWYNSKDAVERSIRFLRGDLHKEPKKVK